MSFKSVIDKLDTETYNKLKASVEVGKWPDGKLLTQEQKDISLQAIIAYEIQHNFPENERTGYVPTKSSACDSSEPSSLNEETPLKWKS